MIPVAERIADVRHWKTLGSGLQSASTIPNSTYSFPKQDKFSIINDLILDHGYWPQSIGNEKRETLHVLIVDWYFSLYNAGSTTVAYRPSRCDLKKH